MTSPSSMHETGHSKPVDWEEQPRGMGWGGRWEGHLGPGDTCTPVAGSYQCMAKTTSIL